MTISRVGAAIIILCAWASAGLAAGRMPSFQSPPFVNTAPAVKSLQSYDYIIGSQDTLIIDVFQVEDLSRTVQVDTSGYILMPLIGQVAAAGRTPPQLSNEIAAALGKDYMTDPIVTVSVKEAASKKVTVDGAVTQPGMYPIVGQTTLLQAIAMAHGPDSIADISKIAIFRNDGDRRVAAMFDLDAIRSGKMTDPFVYPDDIIVVESSGSRKFLRGYSSVLPFFSWLLFLF